MLLVITERKLNEFIKCNKGCVCVYIFFIVTLINSRLVGIKLYSFLVKLMPIDKGYNKILLITFIELSNK